MSSVRDIVFVRNVEWDGSLVQLTMIARHNDGNSATKIMFLGSCESYFCVRIESRIESAVRFDFESNFRIESAVYTKQAVTPSNELQGVFVTNDSDARN